MQLTFDLTVITCTMNSARFIHDLLESLKRQTVPPREHIFVDGNSQDATLLIIEEYSNLVSYPVVVLHQTPSGISSAMNLGSMHATSRYLMHLHSDDKLYSAESLEIAEKALLRSDSKWLVGNCEYIDFEGTHLSMSPTEDFSRDRLLVSNFISHPSVVISKTLFFNLDGFDESLKIAMDYDLWLRASNVEAPIQTSQILSSFRIHPEGASSGNERQMWREDLFVRLKYENGRRARVMARFKFALTYVLVGHPKVSSKLLKGRDFLHRTFTRGETKNMR